ncbi:TNF receptor-associated factor 4 [Pleodorina starrii]|nr:TNF receptor-associated factor 4 [Pleodorina starrii]
MPRNQDHSRNGTFLNGVPLQPGRPIVLSHGDRISLVLSVNPLSELSYLYEEAAPLSYDRRRARSPRGSAASQPNAMSDDEGEMYDDCQRTLLPYNAFLPETEPMPSPPPSATAAAIYGAAAGTMGACAASAVQDGTAAASSSSSSPPPAPPPMVEPRSPDRRRLSRGGSTAAGGDGGAGNCSAGVRRRHRPTPPTEPLRVSGGGGGGRRVSGTGYVSPSEHGEYDSDDAVVSPTASPSVRRAVSRAGSTTHLLDSTGGYLSVAANAAAAATRNSNSNTRRSDLHASIAALLGMHPAPEAAAAGLAETPVTAPWGLSVPAPSPVTAAAYRAVPFADSPSSPARNASSKPRAASSGDWCPGGGSSGFPPRPPRSPSSSTSSTTPRRAQPGGGGAAAAPPPSSPRLAPSRAAISGSSPSSSGSGSTGTANSRPRRLSRLGNVSTPDSRPPDLAAVKADGSGGASTASPMTPQRRAAAAAAGAAASIGAAHGGDDDVNAAAAKLAATLAEPRCGRKTGCRTAGTGVGDDSSGAASDGEEAEQAEFSFSTALRPLVLPPPTPPPSTCGDVAAGAAVSPRGSDGGCRGSAAGSPPEYGCGYNAPRLRSSDCGIRPFSSSSGGAGAVELEQGFLQSPRRAAPGSAGGGWRGGALTAAATVATGSGSASYWPAAPPLGRAFSGSGASLSPDCSPESRAETPSLPHAELVRRNRHPNRRHTRYGESMDTPSTYSPARSGSGQRLRYAGDWMADAAAAEAPRSGDGDGDWTHGSRSPTAEAAAYDSRRNACRLFHGFSPSPPARGGGGDTAASPAARARGSSGGAVADDEHTYPCLPYTPVTLLMHLDSRLGGGGAADGMADRPVGQCCYDSGFGDESACDSHGARCGGGRDVDGNPRSAQGSTSRTTTGDWPSGYRRWESYDSGRGQAPSSGGASCACSWAGALLPYQDASAAGGGALAQTGQRYSASAASDGSMYDGDGVYYNLYNNNIGREWRRSQCIDRLAAAEAAVQGAVQMSETALQACQRVDLHLRAAGSHGQEGRSPCLRGPAEGIAVAAAEAEAERRDAPCPRLSVRPRPDPDTAAAAEAAAEDVPGTSRYPAGAGPEELLCALCGDYLRRAIAVQPCGHTFCGGCLSQYLSAAMAAGCRLGCPEGCVPFSQLSINHPARRLEVLMLGGMDNDGGLETHGGDVTAAAAATPAPPAPAPAAAAATTAVTRAAAAGRVASDPGPMVTAAAPRTAAATPLRLGGAVAGSAGAPASAAPPGTSPLAPSQRRTSHSRPLHPPPPSQHQQQQGDSPYQQSHSFRPDSAGDGGSGGGGRSSPEGTNGVSLGGGDDVGGGGEEGVRMRRRDGSGGGGEDADVDVMCRTAASEALDLCPLPDEVLPLSAARLDVRQAEHLLLRLRELMDLRSEPPAAEAAERCLALLCPLTRLASGHPETREALSAMGALHGCLLVLEQQLRMQLQRERTELVRRLQLQHQHHHHHHHHHQQHQQHHQQQQHDQHEGKGGRERDVRYLPDAVSGQGGPPSGLALGTAAAAEADAAAAAATAAAAAARRSLTAQRAACGLIAALLTPVGSEDGCQQANQWSLARLGGVEVLLRLLRRAACEAAAPPPPPEAAAGLRADGAHGSEAEVQLQLGVREGGGGGDGGGVGGWGQRSRGEAEQLAVAALTALRLLVAGNTMTQAHVACEGTAAVLGVLRDMASCDAVQVAGMQLSAEMARGDDATHAAIRQRLLEEGVMRLAALAFGCGAGGPAYPCSSYPRPCWGRGRGECPGGGRCGSGAGGGGGVGRGPLLAACVTALDALLSPPMPPAFRKAVASELRSLRALPRLRSCLRELELEAATEAGVEVEGPSGDRHGSGGRRAERHSAPTAAAAAGGNTAVEDPLLKEVRHLERHVAALLAATSWWRFVGGGGGCRTGAGDNGEFDDGKEEEAPAGRGGGAGGLQQLPWRVLAATAGAGFTLGAAVTAAVVSALL